MKPQTPWVIIIPARLGSQRFPHKALADLCGKPLIVRVYENLLPLKEALGADLYIACDSHEFADSLSDYKVSTLTVTKRCHSGSDRCYEAVDSLDKEYSYVLNVQGDEPFVATSDLKAMCHSLEEKPQVHITTLVHVVSTQIQEFMKNPHRVKVVLSQSNRILYCSRSPLPYSQNTHAGLFYEHQGVYAYRWKTLKLFKDLPPSSLELAEGLEQLRALENDWTLYAHKTQTEAHSINVPEDLEKAKDILKEPKLGKEK